MNEPIDRRGLKSPIQNHRSGPNSKNSDPQMSSECLDSGQKITGHRFVTILTKQDDRLSSIKKSGEKSKNFEFVFFLDYLNISVHT